MFEILKKPEVVASIITAVVTIVVVIITSIVTIRQSKVNSKIIIEQSKGQRNIDAIIKNRVEWIQVLKEYAVEYLKVVDSIIYSNEPEIYDKMLKEIHILLDKTRLHLGFDEIKNYDIFNKIKRINELLRCANKNDSNTDLFNYICIYEIQILITYFQIYLKTEWERVKYESNNGNIYGFSFSKKYDEYMAIAKIAISELELSIKQIEKEIRVNNPRE